MYEESGSAPSFSKNCICLRSLAVEALIIEDCPLSSSSPIFNPPYLTKNSRNLKLDCPNISKHKLNGRLSTVAPNLMYSSASSTLGHVISKGKVSGPFPSTSMLMC